MAASGLPEVLKSPDLSAPFVAEIQFTVFSCLSEARLSCLRKMILAFESSCDESAVALLDPTSGIVGEWISSQASLHADYGGVVPDLAVREHLENFFPLLNELRLNRSIPKKIERIAATCGPGLIGCLGVGLSIAKTLGILWNLPVYGVNHLRGHAFSPFMNQTSDKGFDWKDWLPHLGLLVSGGNTLLFELDSNFELRVVGRTKDDAAGEALDKGAKLLGLAYPGAAELESNARKGDRFAYSFPRAFNSGKRSDFSFSGLKTSLLYLLQKMDAEEIAQRHADLCASYQEAAVEQLVKKCSLFLKAGNYRSFGLSGGVANNESLRRGFQEVCRQMGTPFLFAEKRHAGDNAAMIAHAARVDPLGLWPNHFGELEFMPGLTLDASPASA